MNRAATTKQKILSHIESLREEYGCEEWRENPSLRWWELCLLGFGGYLKEIIETFIGTFGKKHHLYELCGAWPLNTNYFWVLLLKLVLGGLLLIYFGFRLSDSPSGLVGWYIFIFISWAMLRESVAYVFPSEAFLMVFSLSLTFFYFWFFFVKDRGNMDAWKMAFYDGNDLYRNSFSGELMRDPSKGVSREKVKRMVTVLLCFLMAMFILAIVSKLMIDWLIRISDPGGGTSSTPRNQQNIQTVFKENWFLISLSAIVKAPIVEELIFRKCLMGLGRNGLWISIVSGFLFALMHLKGESYINILSYLMNGIVLSLIVWTVRNIWFSVFAHSMWNVIGIINLLIGFLRGDF